MSGCLFHDAKEMGVNFFFGNHEYDVEGPEAHLETRRGYGALDWKWLHHRFNLPHVDRNAGDPSWKKWVEE